MIARLETMTTQWMILFYKKNGFHTQLSCGENRFFSRHFFS